MRADGVTVLVSTTARPAMLRTALASIARQTVANQIVRVRVSENAGSKESGEVAAEFKDRLPIDFVRRDPTLSSLAHGRALTTELPSTGFVAILHDDDWWTPEHLARSLERLAAHPSASVSYSSFFEVTGESSLLKTDSNLMLWFGADFPAVTSDWLLPEPLIWLSCLLGTPTRYSTLVAPAGLYRQAADITFKLANSYDNDRRIAIELAGLGPVVFSPTPEVFIRMHAAQDSGSFRTADQIKHLSQTTHHLIDLALARKIDLATEIAQRLANCPTDAKPTLLNHLSREFCSAPLLERGVSPAELRDYVALLHRKPNLRYYLGQCIPPLLLNALRRAPREGLK